LPGYLFKYLFSSGLDKKKKMQDKYISHRVKQSTY